ncbi:hypothetical protein [Streptomyces sp. MMS24-I29]|uniref:hypothetical protein n=1 Tax=Streptomyces sp. MMS24-I29 TaxID=3351480 RepID=UPI003C79AF07
MGAEDIGEPGCCGLGRSFAPPVTRTLRSAGNSVVPSEQPGRGLGFGRIHGHGDQRGTELAGTVNKSG